MSELIEVAFQARADFEEGLIGRELLASLYLAYNPHVEIRSFLGIAEARFPRDNCGLAAVYLAHLVGGEVTQGSFDDNNHTFLKHEKAPVVDITADQYGGPKVYVGDLRDPWSYSSAKKVRQYK